MFKQNLKIAYRNIKKGKLFSFINIAGLACGLSAAFIIALFITHELSYDKFHKNYDRTYLAYHTGFMKGYNVHTQFVFYDIIKNGITGIQKSAQMSSTWQPNYFIRDNNYIATENVYFADPELFEILTFNFIYGSPKNISDVNSVLISESALNKYLPGMKNAVGETIQIQLGAAKHFLKVAGIFKDVPAASHMRPDFIMSMGIIRRDCKDHLDDWGFNNPITYILLNPDADKEEVAKSINAVVNKNTPEGSKEKFFLLPLTGLHINDIDISIGKKGSLSKIYIFTVIGIIILLMACFNFINISVAGAASRAKEIGVRKTIGAGRGALIKQLLTESVLIAFMALPIAIILTEILTPPAIEFFDREIGINYISDWKYLTAALALVMAAGLFSGSYYAFAASRFNPIEALSNKINFASSKSSFRRILITLQFAVFTGMIICSIVMYNQMNYLSDADLGYNKENVLKLRIPNGIDAQPQTFKKILSETPGVNCVSINSTTPPSMGNIVYSRFGIPSEKKLYDVNEIQCDENYMKVLGLELIKGEFFSEEDCNTENDKIILNESAAKVFGINSLGYVHSKTGETWHVIGIIKDFNIADLYGAVGSMVMRTGNDFRANYTLRISGKGVPQTMERIQKQWSGFYPDIPFEYQFVDEEYDARYRDDMHLSQMIGFFTGVALYIAVIGLFGISAYSASQRMREIGIRKVFGASVKQLVFLLNKEVLIISIIGSIIAFPLSYYLTEKWLNTFAYKIELGFGIFASAFGLSLLIGLAAVSSQAFKAAIANPIESIRSE